MVAGIFHAGSGLGNMLHRYVATRVLALDKGYNFSMVAPENFKGKSFMNLDMGREFGLSYKTEMPAGKVIPQLDQWTEDNLLLWEEKTNYYNPEVNFIEDNTIIDGEFQDERYFEHRMKEIGGWLGTNKMTGSDVNVSSHLCVIGFRGGEFYLYPELGLPKTYFEEAIQKMRELDSEMQFEVHTDDEALAKQFFPDFKVTHDIGINWRAMVLAKYAIVSNSSFYILPRLLRHHYGWDSFSKPITIAPRFWARRNIKEWSMPANFYKAFRYI